MDLYKAAYTLAPWTPAELVADCFALARRVRVLDMRASPYDFTALVDEREGLAPVPVETPAGRAAYAAAQRAFAEEAAPLRERVLAVARSRSPPRGAGRGRRTPGSAARPRPPRG